MPEFERKRLPFELKAASEGQFGAVFATFNVVDRDGDVTIPGAFKAGTEVIVGAWGHNPGQLPVGKGVIRATPQEATVEGQFFLDTDPGKATYQTVKNLGTLGEWSYIYSATKQSFGEFQGQQVRFLEGVEVFSVDPVLAGAGIDTRTVDIKSLTRELSFTAHSAEIAELVNEYVERVKERAAIREKAGRMLSGANVERLAAIADSLKAAAGDLEKLLTEAEPKTNELVTEFLRSQRILSGFAGAAQGG